MNNQLGVSIQLGALDKLKAAIEDAAKRAERLDSEFRTNKAREERACEEAIEEEQRRSGTALAEGQAAHQAALVAEQKRFESRKVLIGRAYQAAKAQQLQRVEDRLGARKYELQKRMLQGERDRDNGLAATTAAFEQFGQDLAAEQTRLAELERTAQIAFRGHRKLVRQFRKAYEEPRERRQDARAPRAEPFGVGQLGEIRELLGKAEEQMARFRRMLLLRLFKYLPAWILLILFCEVPLVLQRIGWDKSALVRAGEFAGASLVLVIAFRFLSRLAAGPIALAISQGLARARRLHDCALEESEIHYRQEHERIKREYAETVQSVDQQLKQGIAQAGDARVACRLRCDERTVRANSVNEQSHSKRIEGLEQLEITRSKGIEQALEIRTSTLRAALEEKQRKATAEYAASWTALEGEWKTTVEPLYASIASAGEVAARLFPAWPPSARASLPARRQDAGAPRPAWPPGARAPLPASQSRESPAGGMSVPQAWTPPAQFAGAAKFAELQIELEKLCEAFPNDRRLALPGPPDFNVPLCLAYPAQGSILLETGGTGHDEAIAALNNTILRLLSVSPPGRLNFTVLDPVGLGQNFAGVMHLADYEEQIINSRIWTQSGQIDQKLGDLNEHMEKVIQMYLRNEYRTIAEYNEQAGVIAEKYYFLVIADFPANFSETAIKRLLSIAASGARCGVYTLIHWDLRQPLPPDFIPEELRKSSVTLSCQEQRFALSGHKSPGAELALDPPPEPERAIEFIHQVGKASKDSSRVEVPFTQVAPPEPEIWSEDTTSELRVPIGRTGATKLQYLEIGKGTRQHGLVAGKTGSGKSTLFHVVITNLALWCSPEQVEFYLVDFKKGVEFKCYAAHRLPHARVVAIESDREFGLSVLQRLDDELKRRGDLFRQLGVQDLAGYKRAGGKESVPRSLLLIDEFQEFFVEDDKISQTASLLLDRIVRQGRAFGIHVLLGSQTLGGAYTVARTTLGQMVIRIALQCNEADAYLIMDDTNPAPRLLSRPGEGIYNDMAGAIQGNSPFQVVWLPDSERDQWLAKVREKADGVQSPKSKVQSPDGVRGYLGPIVFEGNAPADVRENALLRALLEADSLPVRALAPRVWLGAPNSIKGPTEAAFNRQSGNNLLIVGQREEATLAMLMVGLVSLAAQHPPGMVRLVLCDATPPGTPERQYIERVVKAIPHQVTLAKPADLPDIMKDLDTEMKKRGEEADPDAAPPVFLIVHGLQKFNRLRYDPDLEYSTSESDASLNPAVVLNNLLTEGTRLGFHIIATCDTYNNLSRFLSRKALSEFEMRVLFQMSANDSASLIDNPKAGALGLHRALFNNAQEGYLETFRPYALPGDEWIEEVAKSLARLLRPR